MWSSRANFQEKIPNDLHYTEDDMYKYKSMLLANAYKHKHQHHSQAQVLRRYKYKHIIMPLMSITLKKQKIWKRIISRNDAERQRIGTIPTS